MGKTVLIVDDAAFMRMMIKDILTKGGYEIVGEAENGAVAIKKYRELYPELVIMDITMPESSGITALKEIRAFDPEAKVIICSAMGQKKLISEAMQAGAIDFIIKPFEDFQVLEAARRIFK